MNVGPDLTACYFGEGNSISNENGACDNTHIVIDDNGLERADSKPGIQPK